MRQNKSLEQLNVLLLFCSYWKQLEPSSKLNVCIFINDSSKIQTEVFVCSWKVCLIRQFSRKVKKDIV